MNNIIDITANLPHVTHEVICVKCLSRWWAVALVETRLKDYTCPKCGTGYVIKTGQAINNEW